MTLPAPRRARFGQALLAGARFEWDYPQRFPTQRRMLRLHSDGGKPGLLVGFIEANNALRWTGRPREERKKLIVGRMVDWFGPEAANPIDYEDQDWPAEQWSRGCYEVWTGPGVLTTVGKAIREPVGRI